MKNSISIFLFAATIFLYACSNNNHSAEKQAEAIAVDSLQAKADSANTKTAEAGFKSPKENVTANEAYDLVRQDAILIDVREPEEVEALAYDIKNIMYIPLNDVEARMAEIPKNKQVIVACRKGGRSASAYEILTKNGFTNVANMEGGIEAWSDKGLPTVKSTSKK